MNLQMTSKRYIDIAIANMRYELDLDKEYNRILWVIKHTAERFEITEAQAKAYRAVARSEYDRIKRFREERG